MPLHHVQHAQNVGPILFARNENIAHIMPCVTACAMISCVHAGKPDTVCIRGVPGITYGCAVHAGQMILIKNNHLTF